MTHLVSQKNVDGSPSSRNGISTTSSALTEEQIDRGLEWLRRLPRLPQDQLPAKADVERVSSKLMVPVEPVWCLARVAALLSPYYEKETPQAVREMEAEDWARLWPSFRAGRSSARCAGGKAQTTRIVGSGRSKATLPPAAGSR